MNNRRIVLLLVAALLIVAAVAVVNSLMSGDGAVVMDSEQIRAETVDRLSATPEATSADTVVFLCWVDEAFEACAFELDESPAAVLTTGADGSLITVAPDQSLLAIEQRGTGSFVTTTLDGEVLATMPGSPLVWRSPGEIVVSIADEVVVVDASGDVVDQIAEHPDGVPFRAPVVSPDGARMIAAVGGPTTASDGQHLWIYHFESSTWTPLYTGPEWLIIGTALGYRFSPDGTRVFTHLITKDSQATVDQPDPPADALLESQIVAIEIDTREVEVLGRVQHSTFLSADVSPDGRAVAIRSEQSLIVLDVATGTFSERRRVPFTSGFPGMSWSPESDQLVLDGRFSDSRFQLAVMTYDDGELSKPHVLEDAWLADAMSPVWGN